MGVGYGLFRLDVQNVSTETVVPALVRSDAEDAVWGLLDHRFPFGGPLGTHRLRPGGGREWRGWEAVRKGCGT